MVRKAAIRAVTCLLGVMAIVLMSSCARAPMPTVQSGETFEVVTLGPFEYVTPAGISVVRTGKGFVEHDVVSLPGVWVRVEIDPSPPRDLKIDADAEKRKFVRAMRAGRVASSQYYERDGRENVKIHVTGLSEDREALHGTLKMIRANRQTAVLKVVGPAEKREEMNRFVEQLALSLDVKS